MDVKKSYAADKAELDKSLSPSEEKVANAERRIKEFAYNMGTFHELKSMIDEAKAVSKRS